MANELVTWSGDLPKDGDILSAIGPWVLLSVYPDPSERPGDSPSTVEFRDPEGWWRATVKWDGCIDLWRYFNVPMDVQNRREDDEPSYLHICDLDDTIRRLLALRRLARRAFGKDWPL